MSDLLWSFAGLAVFAWLAFDLLGSFLFAILCGLLGAALALDGGRMPVRFLVTVAGVFLVGRWLILAVGEALAN
jgi:hypothetical protein